MADKEKTSVVFLASSRLILRPPQKGDIKSFVVWRNDQEVGQYTFSYLPAFESDEENWLAGLAERKNRDIILAMETNEGELIGKIELRNIFWKDRVATLIINIGNKEYWGKGYGMEAVKILLRYAFVSLGLRKICLSVFGNNKRAIACYIKCGFEQEGMRKEQFYKDGRYEDEILMAIFKKD